MAIWLRPQGEEENTSLTRSGQLCWTSPGGGRVLHPSEPADEPGAGRTMLLPFLSPRSCQPVPGPRSCSSRDPRAGARSLSSCLSGPWQASPPPPTQADSGLSIFSPYNPFSLGRPGNSNSNSCLNPDDFQTLSSDTHPELQRHFSTLW